MSNSASLVTLIIYPSNKSNPNCVNKLGKQKRMTSSNRIIHLSFLALGNIKNLGNVCVGTSINE